MNTTSPHPSRPSSADWLLPYLPAALVDLLGRAMLALIFIVAGYGKITGYDGSLAYMASHGLPGFLLPPTIALELLAGLALITGFQTRLAALALALFSLASALIFHAQFDDAMQRVMFLKNVAMAGGLLLLAVKPLGSWTIDHQRGA
jgi:putative oxidoreductase